MKELIEKMVRMCLIAGNPEQIAKLKSIIKETWEFDYKIIANEWLVRRGWSTCRCLLEIKKDKDD